MGNGGVFRCERELPSLGLLLRHAKHVTSKLRTLCSLTFSGQAAWGMKWLKRQHDSTTVRGSAWSTHSRLGPDPLRRISIPRSAFFHAHAGGQAPQLPCHAIDQSMTLY